MSSSPTVLPPPPHGYWGPVDANINWCEPDYVFSPYVAELFNTLSSVPISLYGLYGLYHYCTQRRAEPRFALTFLGLVVVGIGSTAFHATLRRSAQCLDELPMMYAALLLLYNSLDHKGNFPSSSSLSFFSSITHRLLLKVILFIGGLLMTLIYFYFPQFFSIFFVGYGSTVVAFVAVMTVSLFSSTGYKRYSSLPRSLYFLSFAGYFGGFALWTVDLGFCGYLPHWIYLHAIWHLSAGFGVYFSIQSQIAWRGEYHKANVAMDKKHLLPFVVVDIKEKK